METTVTGVFETIEGAFFKRPLQNVPFEYRIPIVTLTPRVDDLDKAVFGTRDKRYQLVDRGATVAFYQERV